MTFKSLATGSMIVFALSLSACSTAEVRTMPSADGNHRVVARDIERDNAEKAANEAAKDFCSDQRKMAYFKSANVKYTGSMEEGTRNTVRNASKVASVIGVGAPYGSPDPVRTAGQIGHGMTNDRDYEAEVVFICQ